MDSATEDLYLQKIEEFVYDEDKIVTFKWLSSALGISVGEARTLLEKYVADHRSTKPGELAVTYILSGIGEGDVLSITVVKEDELEDKRDALVSVLDQQIYSVQKSKQADLTAISLIDHFDMHNPSDIIVIGSVRSKNCIKRILKPVKLPPPPQPINKTKPSFFTKLPSKPDQGPIKVNNTSPPSITKQNQAAKAKKNGIANFFSMSMPKAEVKPEISEKFPVETVKQEEHTTKERISSLVDSDSESEDVISPTPTSQPAKQPKPRRSIKRPKKQKDRGPSPKRRKRIVEQNDSDSDDIFGNDENMQQDVAESSGEEEPALKPQPLAPKNKKRKFVDRTFMDEEGFMVTRKEWVEESGSEGEGEEVKVVESNLKEEVKVVESNLKEEVKDNVENNKPIKVQNDNTSDKVPNGKLKTGRGKKPVASNQQTLMSFFKKK